MSLDLAAVQAAFQSEYAEWVERDKADRAAQKSAQWDRTRVKRSYRPDGRSDVLDLVNALGRAEWGPIASPQWRGHRAILSTLAALMFDAHRGRSARLVCTANQIAQRAGYSERWTRIVLTEMEGLGIIQWTRGGIVEGRCTPSVIQIVKKMLCDWIRDARRIHSERAKARLQATRARLSKLRRDTLPPSMLLKAKAQKARRLALESEVRRVKQNEDLLSSLDLHAEVTTSPRLYRGKTRPEGLEEADAKKIIPLKERKEIKEDMLTQRVAQYLPDRCTHGRNEPKECPTCEMMALTYSQGEARRVQAEKLREERANAFTAYMHANYPSARPSQWPRICLRDPEARRLAKEQGFDS